MAKTTVGPLSPQEKEELEAKHRAREEVYKLARESECAECGYQMGVRMQDSELVMSCRDPSHRGYRRLRSLSQLAREGHYIPFVSERVQRKEIEELEDTLTEKGVPVEEQRALVAYGERFPITMEAAGRIIDLFYPDMQVQAKTEALIMACQYNLNPLPSRKEMYIISYNKDKPEKRKDSLVLGIAGHRILARRKAHWRYADGPRLATREEIDAIGEPWEDRVWATVTLETSDGSRYTAYSFYRKAGQNIGEDKLIGADGGNTRFDMACKRAEAKALARIIPPEDLPAPVGIVIEGVYTDITDLPVPTPEHEPPANTRAPAGQGRPPRGTSSAAPASAPAPAPAHGETQTIMGLLKEAGFITAEGKIKADKLPSLKEMLSKCGAEKISQLEGEGLLRFTNHLLDLAIDALGDTG